MSLIEGLGTEVEITFGIGFITIFLIFLYLLKTRDDGNRGNDIDDAIFDDADRPPVYNPNQCPICMNIPSNGIETSCGHLYCGACFIEFHGRMFNGNPLFCPICRQRVTIFLYFKAYLFVLHVLVVTLLFVTKINSQIGLLFRCFTPEERASEENIPSLGRITNFVRTYNRGMTNDMSLMERIREIPILLRYLANGLINGDDDVITTWNRLKIIFFMAFLTTYFITPYDILPEVVYGIFGYGEDVVIVLMSMIYFAAFYRNVIAAQL